jgi:hypothetical protein
VETLQEYEAAIATLEAGGLFLVPDDFDNRPIDPATWTPARLAGERCDQAYHLQAGLRRRLWTGPYQGWARALIGRCRDLIVREYEAHGLIGEMVAPRSPGFVDAGTGIARPPIY